MALDAGIVALMQWMSISNCTQDNPGLTTTPRSVMCCRYAAEAASCVAALRHGSGGRVLPQPLAACGDCGAPDMLSLPAANRGSQSRLRGLSAPGLLCGAMSDK